MHRHTRRTVFIHIASSSLLIFIPDPFRSFLLLSFFIFSISSILPAHSIHLFIYFSFVRHFFRFSFRFWLWDISFLNVSIHVSVYHLCMCVWVWVCSFLNFGYFISILCSHPMFAFYLHNQSEATKKKNTKRKKAKRWKAKESNILLPTHSIFTKTHMHAHRKLARGRHTHNEEKAKKTRQCQYESHVA